MTKVKFVVSAFENNLSALQTILVSGGSTLSELCCMVCRPSEKVEPRWLHVAQLVEFHQELHHHGATNGATWSHSGSTFSIGLQTIQQSSDKVVPPDTSMICEADNVCPRIR